MGLENAAAMAVRLMTFNAASTAGKDTCMRALGVRRFDLEVKSAFRVEADGGMGSLVAGPSSDGLQHSFGSRLRLGVQGFEFQVALNPKP